jgi:hypothetical protein
VYEPPLPPLKLKLAELLALTLGGVELSDGAVSAVTAALVPAASQLL